MLSVISNINSLDAQRNLSNTETQLSSSLQKLSSGMRINSAADDAAGLGISVNLESDVGSYTQASRNANDGISVAQTAEGALNQTSNIITRLRELAMESASDGISDTQRKYVQTEATQLTSEVDRIAQDTTYNGASLLNSASGTLHFQVGIGSSSTNDRISVNTLDATSATLLGSAALDFASASGAVAALSKLDSALNTISDDRSNLGAISNRLSSAASTISTISENLSAADSRIRDVDVAAETSNMSRLNVLSQAGVSVLAQANQQPQIALKLLQ
jgi:flagellin